jgi:hypothetical protein
MYRETQAYERSGSAVCSLRRLLATVAHAACAAVLRGRPLQQNVLDAAQKIGLKRRTA